MSHFFFFTFSHSRCVSLYLFTRTAPQMAEYLCVFAFSETHTQWLNMAPCFSAFHTRPNGLSFFVFFFFSHVQHALDHFSLREVRILTSLGHLSINEQASFEGFWNKLINELDKYVWWNPRVSHAPNIVIVCHLSIIRHG